MEMRNKRSGIAQRLANCGRVNISVEQFFQVVEIPAQQPLLRRSRLFPIFQDIGDCLIDDSQEQALGCLRAELLQLMLHVILPVFCAIEFLPVALVQTFTGQKDLLSPIGRMASF